MIPQSKDNLTVMEVLVSGQDEVKYLRARLLGIKPLHFGTIFRDFFFLEILQTISELIYIQKRANWHTVIACWK